MIYHIIYDYHKKYTIEIMIEYESEVRIMMNKINICT